MRGEVDVRRGAGLDQPALTHHGDLVGEGQGLVLVVGDQQAGGRRPAAPGPRRGRSTRRSRRRGTRTARRAARPWSGARAPAASATRCCWPPESSCGARLRKVRGTARRGRASRRSGCRRGARRGQAEARCWRRRRGAGRARPPAGRSRPAALRGHAAGPSRRHPVVEARSCPRRGVEPGDEPQQGRLAAPGRAQHAVSEPCGRSRGRPVVDLGSPAEGRPGTPCVTPVMPTLMAARLPRCRMSRTVAGTEMSTSSEGVRRGGAVARLGGRRPELGGERRCRWGSAAAWRSARSGWRGRPARRRRRGWGAISGSVTRRAVAIGPTPRLGHVVEHLGSLLERGRDRDRPRGRKRIAYAATSRSGGLVDGRPTGSRRMHQGQADDDAGQRVGDVRAPLDDGGEASAVRTDSHATGARARVTPGRRWRAATVEPSGAGQLAEGELGRRADDQPVDEGYVGTPRRARRAVTRASSGQRGAASASAARRRAAPRPTRRKPRRPRSRSSASSSSRHSSTSTPASALPPQPLKVDLVLVVDRGGERGEAQQCSAPNSASRCSPRAARHRAAPAAAGQHDAGGRCDRAVAERPAPPPAPGRARAAARHGEVDERVVGQGDDSTAPA